MTNDFRKCEGSGGMQMLDWFPDKDYAGAVVCIHCSFGVMIVKNSDHNAVSQSGVDGRAGKVRVHYVTRGTRTEEPRMKYATTKGVPS
jgi:hypothetical protein